MEWDACVVSLAEAYRRKRERQEVVKKNHGPGREFKFSLSPGEVVEWDSERGERELLLVRACSQEPRIALVRLNDAREKKFLMKTASYIRAVPNTLRKRRTNKVRVTTLGEVVEAHD